MISAPGSEQPENFSGSDNGPPASPLDAGIEAGKADAAVDDLVSQQVNLPYDLRRRVLRDLHDPRNGAGGFTWLNISQVKGHISAGQFLDASHHRREF